MMGYTHAVIGAAGALTAAALIGNTSPDTFIMASLAGALGGVAIDIDAKDHFENPKVTEAGRTRLVVLGLLVVGAIVDLFFADGTLYYIVTMGNIGIGGAVGFAVLLLLGHFTEHRTFTHSLLFVILTTIAVFCVLPYLAGYYALGGVLHLILDLFNYQFNHHGVWLFYPIRTGKGIAFGLCKAARTGNKVLYFIGVIWFILLTAYFILMREPGDEVVAPVILSAYLLVCLHFVRVKSEKEQRHIMHMRGEL